MLCFLVSYSMCHEHFFFFHQGVATKLVFKQLTSGSVLLFQNDLLYLHLFFVPSCISVMPEREENLPHCMLFILVLFTQMSTFYFVQTTVPLWMASTSPCFQATDLLVCIFESSACSLKHVLFSILWIIVMIKFVLCGMLVRKAYVICIQVGTLATATQCIPLSHQCQNGPFRCSCLQSASCITLQWHLAERNGIEPPQQQAGTWHELTCNTFACLPVVLVIVLLQRKFPKQDFGSTLASVLCQLNPLTLKFFCKKVLRFTFLLFFIIFFFLKLLHIASLGMINIALPVQFISEIYMKDICSERETFPQHTLKVWA